MVRKKVKKQKLTCTRCGHEYKGEVTTLSQSKCPSCHAIFFTDEEKIPQFSYHKYKDATAFGHDKKTGQPVAIDTKGRRIDPKDTRYDLKTDPRGWKAIYGRKAKVRY